MVTVKKSPHEGLSAVIPPIFIPNTPFTVSKPVGNEYLPQRCLEEGTMPQQWSKIALSRSVGMRDEPR